MTPNTQARQLIQEYDAVRLNHLRPATCIHRTIVNELEHLTARSHGLVTIEELGSSLEGRSINLLRAGKGPKSVLLWSQMHGDESTATLALCDLIHYLALHGEEKGWVRSMLEQITIGMIPMLNPDGAEACRRQNAVQVDINRDARGLTTPEARILRETHRALRPLFG